MGKGNRRNEINELGKRENMCLHDPWSTKKVAWKNKRNH